jgi:hypothetical protein
MLLNLLLTLMHHGLSLYIDHTHFTVSATGTINDDDDDDDDDKATSYYLKRGRNALRFAHSLAKSRSLHIHNVSNFYMLHI